MQLRVVTDQPWDVAADVLAVPVAGEPTFEGPLGEIDRRAGGELRALAAFGELTGTRYATAIAAAGDLPAGRLLAVGAGSLAELDRETVVRLGATVERRLAGRPVRPPGDLARRACRRARRRRRGRGGAARPRRRRGQLRPGHDLPRRPRRRAARARRADPRGARRGRRGVAAAAERGVIIGRGERT